jgi:Holliday junction resolvase RusA-like endonuclease
MATLKITIYGDAQPQGSMRAFTPKGARFPVLISDNTKLKPWRQQVAATALSEMEAQSVSMILRPEPVSITVTFFFDRPKSVKKSAAKITKPDLDKLLRGTLDGLKGVAYEDDAQVTDSVAKKRYGAPARTEIMLSLASTE